MSDAISFFAKGLKANYTALPQKSPYTIYFCLDTRELFLGDDLYTEPVRFYAGALPGTPAQGTLYIDTNTGVGSVHNGTEWKTVFRAVATEIGEDASDDEIPTTKAVKDYVDETIEDAMKDITANPPGDENEMIDRITKLETALTWVTL